MSTSRRCRGRVPVCHVDLALAQFYYTGAQTNSYEVPTTGDETPKVFLSIIQ